ncbi:MAG TPA: DinB family protein, partial [Thermoanaerobaculia bacterium]|nr:DinB family protein [Thermoanaerobaculia bacterium]
IDALSATPSRVRALIEGLSEAELSFTPGPDTFSIRENVAHLRDIDLLGYEQRVARTLDELEPHLPDLDGAALAIERDYAHQPVGPALEAFAASRARSIARLRRAAEADLARTAVYEGTGVVTLRRILELWIEHDAGHLHDIELLLAGENPSRLAS